MSLVRTGRTPDGTTPWRLVCNRDELRTRAPADPPASRRAGRVRVVAPRDPDGGGTWVAASSAGLGFVLLNRPGLGCDDRAPLVTRGAIIPSIWDCPSIDAVRLRLETTAVRTRPFTLVVVDDQVAVEFVDTAQGVREAGARRDARLMWTSSAWCPGTVRRHRSRLFRRLVLATDPPAQDDYHAREDVDVPARGVLMRRADACTVSVTTIEMSAERACLRYWPFTSPGGEHVHDVPRGA